MNYAGHGTTGVWRGNLQTSADATALTNGNQFALVIAMTCLNGDFHDVATDSLGETLLKAKRGGAVATWASSSLTDSTSQALVNQAALPGLSTWDKLSAKPCGQPN